MAYRRVRVEQECAGLVPDRRLRITEVALERDLGFSDPHNSRPFHPHITLAHRDLDERDFSEVQAFFQKKTFLREFEADALTLLRNVQGRWAVDRTFEFGTVRLPECK